MSCENSENVSIEFVKDFSETTLEIRPRELQFNRNRGKFDHLQAEFSEEVANHLEPNVEYGGSPLRQPLPVYLKIQGRRIYRLLWVPEAARFVNGKVHIEFHDTQKYLTRGTVDWKRENVKLKEAYEYVFDQRDTSGPQIFKDIKFNTTDEAYEQLLSERGDEGSKVSSARFYDSISNTLGEWLAAGNEDLREDSRVNVSQVMDGHYAVDFDKMSPWECITWLNEKFGVTTWSDRRGNLWVGSRPNTGITHVSAVDDSRVWKISEYNITPPRDPVVKSVVRGAWADDPSDSTTENIVDVEKLNFGTKDFRVEGVAQLSGQSVGQEIFIEVDGKRDAIQALAKRRMMNKQRQQWEGFIEFNPDFSGDEITDIRDLQIGDRVATIAPETESKVCSNNIKDALFDVVGVQMGLTPAGNLTVRASVVPVLDGDLSPEKIDTKIRYYDPASEDTITENMYDTTESDGFWSWS